MKKEIQILQPLDVENNCIGIHYKNKLTFEDFQSVAKEGDIAWQHSHIFEEDQKYTYLNLFIKNKDLTQYSQDPTALNSCQSLLESQKLAAITAQVDFSDLCFFELLPDHLLKKWFSLRELAMQNIAMKVERPPDYEILHRIHVLTANVAKQAIIINGQEEKIKYDIFSSATGRLSTAKGSYPILSVSKEERSNVVPQNDLYLEIDLNGAEIRTLLAFSGIDQPLEDIHMWNMRDLPPWITRKEAKEEFFAWLYNPASENKNYEKFYNKKAYLDHFDGTSVTTPFGRKLPVDERKALNYLLQSTTSDIVLYNTYEIMKKLKKKKSFVAFTMHDSVVLDFAREDYDLVSELKDIFEKNMFGRFLSSVRIGKDFGTMKEIVI
jgi:hypothetical protein